MQSATASKVVCSCIRCKVYVHTSETVEGDVITLLLWYRVKPSCNWEKFQYSQKKTRLGQL